MSKFCQKIRITKMFVTANFAENTKWIIFKYFFIKTAEIIKNDIFSTFYYIKKIKKWIRKLQLKLKIQLKLKNTI